MDAKSACCCPITKPFLDLVVFHSQFFVRTPTTKSFHPAVEVVFSGVWDNDFIKNYKVDVPTTK